MLMYQEVEPRYSYEVDDYANLWVRLQSELSRRSVWRQGDVIELMEWLETEARPQDSGVLEPVEDTSDEV